MTLEKLQEMSDRELDELAAINILWGGIVNVPSDGWRPTTDMNDAMKLVTIVGDDYNFELNRKPSGVDHLLFEAVFTDGSDVYRSIGSNAARCITTAAILAKGPE